MSHPFSFVFFMDAYCTWIFNVLRYLFFMDDILMCMDIFFMWMDEIFINGYNACI